MQRIIKNDNVIVIAGKNKGQVGKVLQVLVKDNKAIVDGINKVKRFQKNEDPSKRVVEKEQPIHLSNLALYDTKKKVKIAKVSYVFKDEIKIRVNRKTKEPIK